MIANNKRDIIKIRKKQNENVSVNNEINALQSITINPTELCNRTCYFCPRHDPKIYPNQNLHMSEETAKRLASQLKSIDYKNKVIWSGNGEPLLNKNILNLIKIIHNDNPQLRIHEVNTNGDKLSAVLIDDLYSAGINHIMVSVYDGEESFEKFTKLFENYNSNSYTLRKSYYHNLDLTDFTNRGGATKLNSHVKFNENKCYLPFYRLFIDWNGDIILCCEDWRKITKNILKLNINTHNIKEIWLSEVLNKYRTRLKEGDRSLSPCNSCNIHGERVGEEYVKIFKL
jgi:MoaA/NifB/PqqE/SkfB family radical SAM enzyme